MKKLSISLAFLIVSIVGNAQTTNLIGCFGLQFGCSQEIVRQMMKEKHPEAELLRDDAKSLGYSGGTWAGRDAYLWIFSFTEDGKFHTGTVAVKPSNEIGIWSLYDDICADVVNKYGQEDVDQEAWLYPYAAKDKYSYGVTALKNGKATLYKNWFIENDTPTDEDDNSIQVKISDGVYVAVKYQDAILIDQVVKRNSEKRQNDM